MALDRSYCYECQLLSFMLYLPPLKEKKIFIILKCSGSWFVVCPYAWSLLDWCFLPNTGSIFHLLLQGSNSPLIPSFRL